MKVTYFLALLSLSILLSGCANYQVGGDVQAGVQALIAGNNQTALAYFQAAAQQNPNYIYSGMLNQGVLSYLGRAQYLNKDYTQARQTLEKALRQNKTDNLARLYLGLTQARLGDNQAGLNNIEASMKRINAWLNYLNGNFPDQGWDPGGAIQGGVKNALAMIASGKVDWPRLFVYGESVALGVEQQEETFRQQFIDSTRLWAPGDLIERSQLCASKLPCFEILTSLEHDADFPYWTKVQYTALTLFAREILTPTGVG